MGKHWIIGNPIRMIPSTSIYIDRMMVLKRICIGFKAAMLSAKVGLLDLELVVEQKAIQDQNKMGLVA